MEATITCRRLAGREAGAYGQRVEEEASERASEGD